MVSRFTELAIDCAEPAALARFWCAVLDYEVTDEEDGLATIAVPEGKVVKNRLHLDLNPVDRDQDEEVRRLLNLGARRIDVGQSDDARWAVLCDPEGNEFCVLRTVVSRP